MNIASTVLLADMWDTNGHMGGGWWIVMMLWMVFFWAAVIFGVFWLARGSFEGWRSGRTESPLDTLDRRFAEGAISVDEYRERREMLGDRSNGQTDRARDPAHR